MQTACRTLVPRRLPAFCVGSVEMAGSLSPTEHSHDQVRSSDDKPSTSIVISAVSRVDSPTAPAANVNPVYSWESMNIDEFGWKH